MFSLTPTGEYRLATDDEVIATALRVMDTRVARGAPVSSPADLMAFVALRSGTLPHEVFGVIFLDAQNRVIESCEMFRGTLTQTSVYPREIVKEALALNAAAVMLYHNHPSGLAEPSRADALLTQTLKTALALVDVRVLDHFVVGGGTVVSFAEKGLL